MAKRHPEECEKSTVARCRCDCKGKLHGIHAKSTPLPWRQYVKQRDNAAEKKLTN